MGIKNESKQKHGKRHTCEILLIEWRKEKKYNNNNINNEKSTEYRL